MIKQLKSCVLAAVAGVSLIGTAAKCAAEDVVRNTTKEVS